MAQTYRGALGTKEGIMGFWAVTIGDVIGYVLTVVIAILAGVVVYNVYKVRVSLSNITTNIDKSVNINASENRLGGVGFHVGDTGVHNGDTFNGNKVNGGRNG
jgi:hypothetical protein